MYNGVDVILCLNGFHLVFFRFGQHHPQIVADAFAREFEQGLLSCPKVEELHRGVSRSVDDRLLAFVHGVADQRRGDFAGGFHIRADGPVAEGAQGHGAGMAEAEVDAGMLGKKGFALRGVVEKGRFQDAILLLQTLHQEQIDRKGETLAAFVAVPQRLLAALRRHLCQCRRKVKPVRMSVEIDHA